MDEALQSAVTAYLAAEDVDLDDLQVQGGGRARVLKVVVDADGGLGVDRIADLSRGLSRLLDERDVLDGPYTLEVSSPGLERKLTRPSHYRKSVGREVVVTTGPAVDGEHSHRGLLEAVAAGGVTLRVGDGAREIPFDQITRAQTVFRWEAKPKPGRK
ncbi:MAG: ribosome maturation factor RimP [Actinobacteria bacterium]|nr:ribosome maturation factor RimP [Actinomycetota bacterium]